MYLNPAKRNTDLNKLSIGLFDMPEEIVIRLIYAAKWRYADGDDDSLARQQQKSVYLPILFLFQSLSI